MQFREVLARPSIQMIFVCGKGGVGKTAVSQALALAAAAKGRRTLWVAFEDPLRPPGELRKIAPNLEHLNCDAGVAFEEYIGLKLRLPGLTRIFTQNKLMKYLAKATPGMHELVLLGKVWHEREKHDVVVCDLPATGHGLAMFQSTSNFARLFQGGPIHHDAVAMLETFGDPTRSAFVTVALPEEMPLRESLELTEYLKGLFPRNPPAFVVNRRFPRVPDGGVGEPDSWSNPVPDSLTDYARKRSILETANLKMWQDLAIPYAELDWISPRHAPTPARIAELLLEQLRAKAYA